ncbi:MAG: FlgD immunoglobulin-like domain containing protein [Candidatus Eisenbacteria bacterium]
MRIEPIRLAQAFACTFALASASPARAETYSITDLGSLGGARGSGALALNGNGAVVGYSFVQGTNFVHAMVNRYGTVEDLGTLGGTQSLARSVNAAGDAVGWAYPTGVATQLAVLWRDGQVVPIGTFGGNSSDARDINNAGLVVGSAFDAGGDEHAFWWQGDVLHDMGTFGGTQSRAYASNEWGDIVGWAAITNDAGLHAFLGKRDGELYDLGTLGGPASHAYDVNESVHLCGWSMLAPNWPPSRGWFWANGIMKSLGTLGGIYSSAFGLNNLDQVVGASTRADEVQVAFLWNNDRMTDLNTLVAGGSGWFLTRAWDIDDQGAIVCEGTYGGVPRAVLLTPSNTVSTPPGAPTTLSFAGASPNPMNAGGAFAFALPAEAAVRLELYDTGGRRLLALADGPFRAGASRVPWDGRDENGAALAPGAYWARLTVGGRGISRAFVVVR